MKRGWVRIIGGRWRGRRIPVPPLDIVRPTPDRVRETVFNWLQTAIIDAHCLDAFAGSGVLGFESLSRGARAVTFVEADRAVFQQLTLSAEIFSPSPCELIHQSLMKAHFKANTKFNVVFLDPPFRQGLVASAAHFLEQQNCLADNALIYAETESSLETTNMPANWQLQKQKKAGQVAYALWQKIGSSSLP